ncbi:MAG: hypothetical protein ACXACI_14430 [Candidatus Hodarchaeales archaeon]|jgi:hypothetical protein
MQRVGNIMKLGDIMVRLMDRHLDYYKIHYEGEIDRLYDIFSSLSENELTAINPILLLTDQRPHSLVAIAYALRLAHALKSEIFARTQGVHAETIKQEADELHITVSFLEKTTKATIREILDAIQTYDVALVIIPFRHELSESLLKNSHVSILATKARHLPRLSYVS